MGLGPTIALGLLAWNLVERGRRDEADEFLPWALKRTTGRGFAVGEGTTRAALASAELSAGDAGAAEREALRAAKLTCTTPRYAMHAYAVLVRARVALGDITGALRASRAALAMAERHHPVGPTEVPLRVAHAEALFASGDSAGAGAAIADARSRLLARAERCRDPEARVLYLEHTPSPARTLALATAWGV